MFALKPQGITNQGQMNVELEKLTIGDCNKIRE